MHISETVLNDKGRIDQNKIRLVARLGADWYCKAFGDALFEIEKPVKNKGIGIDVLPEEIRLSPVLTGNNLGQLGNVEQLPQPAEIEEFRGKSLAAQDLYRRFAHHPESFEYEKQVIAKQLLDTGEIEEAWKILLLPLT